MIARKRSRPPSGRDARPASAAGDAAHELRRMADALERGELDDCRPIVVEAARHVADLVDRAAREDCERIAELSPTQREILRACLTAGAVDHASRRTHAELSAAIGSAHNSRFKASASGLVRLGLLVSRGGCAGGVWLTSAGERIALSFFERSAMVVTDSGGRHR